MLYLSTACATETELRDAYATTSIPPPEDLTFEQVTKSELLEEPEQVLRQIQAESFVVINPIDRIEESSDDEYLSFLNAFKDRLNQTDSVGMFHGLDADPVPDNRRLTMERADYVWQLDQYVETHEIKLRLLVTKARGGRALAQTVPLTIADRVHIDTSYSI